MSGSLIAVPQHDNSAALAVSKNGDYLPRLKLCQSNAKEVARRKVARGGNWAVVRSKDDIEDLDEEVVIIPIMGRAKAMEIGDVILTNFEKDSPEFKRIKATADADKDSGCMWGPEYLCWLPGTKEFVTFYMSSKTARQEGGAVGERMGMAALLKGNLIETKKHSWYGPVCTDYAGAVTNLPEAELLNEVVDRFKNERSSKVRKEDVPEDQRER